MDVQPVVAATALPPGAAPAQGPGTAASPAAGEPGTANAPAAPASGFAELLAAGITLPAVTTGPDLPLPPESKDDTQAGADAGQAVPYAPGTGDPTLAVVLAAIAVPTTVQGTPADAAAGTATIAESQHAPLDFPRLPKAAADPGNGTVTPFSVPGAEHDAGSATALRAADGIAGPLQALPQAHAEAARAQAAVVARAAVAAEMRAPVGSAGWDVQLGRTVLWMAGDNHQVAEVRLNPPDLGPLQIVLHMTGDDGSKASVSFTSPHADVRAALENALPRLRDMLAASGIALGQASVGAESFRDAGGGRRASADDNAGGADAVLAALPAAVRAGSGLVDTFA